VRPREVFLVLIGLLVTILVSTTAVVIWVPAARGPGFALLSGVVAAVLSSAVGLYGVWLNLSRQTERARFDRLLEAYGKLLRAGDKLRAAATELMMYPKGRPSPYEVSTGARVSSTPPEARSWNRYYISDALFDEAQQLGDEAEAVIVLEEGEASEVLGAWQAVLKTLDPLPAAVAAKDGRRLEDLREDVMEGVAYLRVIAHRRLKSLR